MVPLNNFASMKNCLGCKVDLLSALGVVIPGFTSFFCLISIRQYANETIIYMNIGCQNVSLMI